MNILLSQTDFLLQRGHYTALASSYIATRVSCVTIYIHIMLNGALEKKIQ